MNNIQYYQDKINYYNNYNSVISDYKIQKYQYKINLLNGGTDYDINLLLNDTNINIKIDDTPITNNNKIKNNIDNYDNETRLSYLYYIINNMNIDKIVKSIIKINLNNMNNIKIDNLNDIIKKNKKSIENINYSKTINDILKKTSSELNNKINDIIDKYKKIFYDKITIENQLYNKYINELNDKIDLFNTYKIIFKKIDILIDNKKDLNYYKILCSKTLDDYIYNINNINNNINDILKIHNKYINIYSSRNIDLISFDTSIINTENTINTINTIKSYLNEMQLLKNNLIYKYMINIEENDINNILLDINNFNNDVKNKKIITNIVIDNDMRNNTKNNNYEFIIQFIEHIFGSYRLYKNYDFKFNTDYINNIINDIKEIYNNTKKINYIDYIINRDRFDIQNLLSNDNLFCLIFDNDFINRYYNIIDFMKNHNYNKYTNFDSILYDINILSNSINEYKYINIEIKEFPNKYNNIKQNVLYTMKSFGYIGNTSQISDIFTSHKNFANQSYINFYRYILLYIYFFCYQ